jgi:dTDP-4-dehydrorhamnose 3,5-epimerase
MKIQHTSISDVLLIEPDVFKDSRGHFLETYSINTYASANIHPLVQFNQSYSTKGVLRGLHFQLKPYDQGKLVYVVQGLVQDVAVDLREKSKTFMKYVSVELSGENKRQLWIPPGFAHGFLVLSDEAIFCYGVSKPYNKASERGIIDVAWKDTSNIIVSDKDQILPSSNDYFSKNSQRIGRTKYQGAEEKQECKVVCLTEFEEKSKKNRGQNIINLTLKNIKNFE